MKLEIVSVFDRALGAFLPPFAVQATGLAMRSFLDECGSKDGNSTIGKHPQDYELHHLGTFHQLEGRMELFPVPKLLTRGLSPSIPLGMEQEADGALKLRRAS